MEEPITVVLARRPGEREITEGNLAELPIWALNPREAKPEKKEDYDRTIILKEEHRPDGTKNVESLRIVASVAYGYPTMLAFRVLTALIEDLYAHKFASPVVTITRYQLAQRVGMKKPSALQYQDLENALEALEGVRITFKNIWYDKRQRCRLPDMISEGFVYTHHWHDERHAVVARAKQGAQEGAGQAPRSYIRISDQLFESLKSGYYIGVDLGYMIALGRPLSERLYVYLTKKDGDQMARYTEDLKQLSRKVGLKADRPSLILRSLEPALNRLCETIHRPDEPPGKEGMRFLERWHLSSDQQKITFEFHRPNLRSKLQRALAVPAK